MEKTKFNYRRCTQRIFNYITDSLEKGKSLQRISEGLRNIVNSYSDLNRNERYRIYLDAYNTTRAARTSPDWRKKLCERQSFDTIVTGCRVAQSRSSLRKKKASIRASLREPGQIFFICSVHEKAAPDHKDWQGKIYVDRFWREKVPGSMFYSVLSYIKNHHILTVQEIMGAPVYLITRPNCKHYFIPLDTMSVLRRSERSIREEIGYRKDLPWTEKDKAELRAQVFENLNRGYPCFQFKQVAKK